MHSLDQKHLARIVLLTFGILVVACVVYTLVLNVLRGEPTAEAGAQAQRLGDRARVFVSPIGGTPVTPATKTPTATMSLTIGTSSPISPWFQLSGFARSTWVAETPHATSTIIKPAPADATPVTITPTLRIPTIYRTVAPLPIPHSTTFFQTNPPTLAPEVMPGIMPLFGRGQ